jgi:putative transcriptional regulator
MSKIGDEIIQGLTEALAHAQGEKIDVVVHHIDIGAPDLKAIRKRMKLSQVAMAPLLGISVSGYRKWEQGERAVPGPARTLLRVMEKEPEAVLRALTEAA